MRIEGSETHALFQSTVFQRVSLYHVQNPHVNKLSQKQSYFDNQCGTSGYMYECKAYEVVLIRISYINYIVQ